MPGSWSTFFCHLYDNDTELNLRDTSWEEGGIFLITLDLGFPAPRDVVSDAPGRDGTLDFTSNFGARTVTAALKVKSTETTSLNAILDQLRELSTPGRRSLRMEVQRDGWDSPRNIWLRANQFSCVINKTSHISADVTLSWAGYNGDMVSTIPTEYNISPLFEAAGWLVPSGDVGSVVLTVPSGDPGSTAITVISGTGDNTQTINNSGSLPVAPTFIIQGPCDNPEIYNQTTGDKLKFLNYSIPAGLQVIVDTANRTATVSGSSVYSKIDQTHPPWWTLPKGDSTIQFNTDGSGDGCVLTVTFRTRYI